MNLKYYLLIFQLEGYRINRYLRWIARHHFKAEVKPAKEPVWTTKAQILYWLSLALFTTSILLSWRILEFPVSLLVIALLWFNIYIFLVLALLLMKPYEIGNKIRVKFLIKQKIKSLNHLKVIGITGSFGKTSTKMVLQQLLPASLMTPKSYNTLFGIYQAVDYELNKRYRFFICEMGAYKRGDVKEFCELTNPSIGILTGINEQHLERFGSIENTISAKFEVLTNLRPGSIGIVNLDNQLVRDNLQRANIELIGYTTENYHSSQCQDILAITDWHIENGLSVFKLQHRNSSYSLTTPLIGKGHLSNILAAIAVALTVGEDMNILIERIKHLKQIPHRLEYKSGPGFAILDDTYSSNPTGFREALDVLKHFKGKKVLVTPGIVELGDKTKEIHHELGKLAANVCDEVVLVGRSAQVAAIQEGMAVSGFAADKVTLLEQRANLQELLRNRANSGAVFLLENDLPDQYV